MSLSINEKIAIITNRSGEKGLSQTQFEALINEILSPSYGELRTVNGSTPQIPGLTPTLFTGFNTNGLSTDNVIVDHTSDTIIAVNSGAYFVDAQFSFSGSFNTTFTMELFTSLNTIPIASTVKTIRKLSAGGDIGSSSFPTIIELLDNDEIGIFVNGDGAGDQITMFYSQFLIIKL